MTYSSIILPITLLLFSTVSNGQTTEAKKPAVTKGYYSIGKNNLKLIVDSTPSSADSIVIPKITKGYYAIKDKNKQIASKPTDKNRRVHKPVVTKGYYSIGNNAEKLVDKE